MARPVFAKSRPQDSTSGMESFNLTFDDVIRPQDLIMARAEQSLPCRCCYLHHLGESLLPFFSLQHGNFSLACPVGKPITMILGLQPFLLRSFYFELWCSEKIVLLDLVSSGGKGHGHDRRGCSMILHASEHGSQTGAEQMLQSVFTLKKSIFQHKSFPTKPHPSSPSNLS